MRKLKVNKYELDEKGYSLGVKRLYIPYEIKWTCPNCGEPQTEDYFDVPIATEENIEAIKHGYLYCEDCEHEEEFKYKVSIQLDVIEE